MTFTPEPGATNHEFDTAMRTVTLQFAHYLARLSFNLKPDNVEVFEVSNSQKRPRIVYIYQVQDQGELVQTFMYGQDTRIHTPTILFPTELLDGAIVSGNYKNAMKIPTFMHCRNSVCLELFQRHKNKELLFAGVIFTRGHNDNHDLKERSAYFAAKLAKMLQADGAIITIEGTGNTIIDAMLTVRACETAGIKTVLKIHEHAGKDGHDLPVADFVEEADVIVSTGNLDEPIVVPPVDTVLGPLPLEFYGRPPIDPWKGGEVTGHELYVSQWQMGISGYSCMAL
jgi:glycine reductase